MFDVLTETADTMSNSHVNGTNNVGVMVVALRMPSFVTLFPNMID